MLKQTLFKINHSFLTHFSEKELVHLLIANSNFKLLHTCFLAYPTNPERKALTAAWVRSSAQSLFKILRTWVLTVPTVM